MARKMESSKRSDVERELSSKPNKAQREARSAKIAAAQGLKTAADFANVFSAMVTDILEERIDPRISNAACNAGGKLLKVVEMQYKYGIKPGTRAGRRPKLQLASDV